MFDDCYFNQPVEDMSASIPCCDLFKELNFCPCSDSSFSCPFFIDSSSVRSIVIKSVFSSVYPKLKL